MRTAPAPGFPSDIEVSPRPFMVHGFGVGYIVTVSLLIAGIVSGLSMESLER